MTDRYRGRTTRERKLAEKVAREWAERRAAAEATEQQVDLDRASAEAEVELLDPAARRAEPEAPGSAGSPWRRRGSWGRAGGAGRSQGPRIGPGRRPGAARARRVPDLAVLPRLLHETGSFATLRERLGPAGAPAAGIHGRHVGLTTVPHGAKSYLAAAIALAPGGERICWVARDAEIGDRVAEELGAWLGDPSLVAVLEPRTSLAYERSELVPDETAARVAALAAWRGGRARVLVASVQALLQATLAPDDLPAQIRTLQARFTGQPRRAPRRALRARLHARAGGRGPGRVRAARRHRGRVPAVRGAAGPDRAVRRRDRLAARVRPDGPAERGAGRGDRPAPRDGVPPAARGRRRDQGAAGPDGRPAARAPGAGPGALRRRRGARGRGPRHGGSRAPGGRRRRGLVRGSSRRTRASTTSTRPPCSSSTSPATSPTPRSSCGARRTSATRSWSRAGSCRRTGRPPTSRRATGRRASTARGRWSSPGSPRRARRTAWRSPRGASPRATCSAGATRSCRRAGRSGWSTAWSTGWRSGRASCSCQRPGAAPRGAAGRGRAPRRHRQPDLRGAAARGHRARGAEPQRRLRGRPGRAGRRHGPRAVRHRARPPAQGHAARRPARHPGAADGRRPRRPHRPRHRALRADAPARRGGPGAGLPGAVVRGRGPDLRPGGADQPRLAATPAGSRRSCRGWAARTGCGRSSGSARRSRTWPRSCSGCTRSARRPTGFAYAPDSPWQTEMEASFPYEETPDQLRAADRGQGRHGDAPADGPAGRGRRGLRQDRGGAAGRVQGDPGRQAGGRARPDDRAGRAALHHVHPAVRGLPDHGQAAVAVRGPEGPGRDDRRAGERRRGHRDRDAPAAVARTWRSGTWAWWWWTRSSGSASRRRSGSSSCGPRWTC